MTVPGVARPGWDEYFLAVAKAVAARADCTRAQHGCVLVDADHRIVSTGYNGTPPGDLRSCFAGDCPRSSSDVAPGAGDYAECIALHAEQNAVANAGRLLRGCTAYITGAPCSMCAKLLAAAGVTRIVHPDLPVWGTVRYHLPARPHDACILLAKFGGAPGWVCSDRCPPAAPAILT